MTDLNTSLLSRLVVWAATENIKRSDPEKARSLGVVPKNWVPPQGSSGYGKINEEGGWEQGSWAIAERNGVCQTAFCIAGNAAMQNSDSLILMGYCGEYNGKKAYSGSATISKALLPKSLPDTVEVDEDFGIVWLGKEQWEYSEGTRAEAEFYAFVSDYSQTIRDTGMETLGLTEDQASVLFGGGNDIEDVVSYATAIAQVHGETLDLPKWVTDEYLDERLVSEQAEWL